VQVQGFPFPPGPKKFRLFHEPDELLDRRERDLTGILAPAERWPGAPFVPLGDPMQDGVGSASYAQRSDVPDLTFDEQLPKIVPLRVATGYYLAPEDPDPKPSSACSKWTSRPSSASRSGMCWCRRNSSAST
jgi:photosynthetic reaction center H subunit